MFRSIAQVSSTANLRVAVVGSGPAGFYAAAALLAADLDLEVDLLERLPTPWGLVRLGVAPDHPNIKAVSRAFEKTALQTGFRFFGNVEVGRDVSVQELARLYDAVVYAVGAQTDRQLGIPGEDLPGSWAATEFVAWYNGHPDYQELEFDLSHERAVVIGNGNVALDVARMLALTPEELAPTDTTDAAIEAINAAGVREILVVGRRGPVQAAWTPVEVGELGELAGADIIVDPAQLELDEASAAELEAAPPTVKRNIEHLRAYAARPPAGKPRAIRLRFLASPVRILGEDQVEAIELARNELVGGRAVPTGEEHETIPCGIVFRSVGYRGVAVPGLPFDDDSHTIPNERGRVEPGLYAAGWIKRGPSGVIGTNKKDAAETVEQLLDDARMGRLPRPRRRHARRPARGARRRGRPLCRLGGDRPDREGRGGAARPAAAQADDLGRPARGRQGRSDVARDPSAAALILAAGVIRAQRRPDMAETASRGEDGFLERRFRFAANGTTLGRDTMAGVTTFIVMSYIIFVNPQILSFAGVEELSELGLPFNQVLAVTCLVAGVMTILMGLYTNRAYAIAPGLGLNAVVAFSLVAGEGLSFPAAMGLIVVEGIAVTILVLTGMRERIMDAIPLDLKKAIAIGIGLFIAFIGMVNSGIVVRGHARRRPGPPDHLADLLHLLRARPHDRAARARRPRRPADRDHPDDDPRHGHQRSLRRRRRLHGRSSLARRRLRAARSGTARRLQLRRVHRARVHLRRRLGLLALPRRLLRHDGHARRRRQAGRLPRRGRAAAGDPQAAAGRLARRGRRRRRVLLLGHDLHRVGLRGERRRTERGGSPSSAARSSSRSCSSPRSSAWCRRRRLPRR